MIAANPSGPHLQRAQRVVQRIIACSKVAPDSFHLGSHPRGEKMIEYAFALKAARLIDDMEQIEAGECHPHCDASKGVAPVSGFRARILNSTAFPRSEASKKDGITAAV